MATTIEWTDATWNPVRGCSRVSEGCRHCYAEGIAARFSGKGLAYRDLAHMATLPDGKKEGRWTGKVVAAPDRILTAPLRWRKPRRVFVNSMSDLFHEALPDATIDRIFAVMALCPHLTFQVLTKRPERMRAYLTGPHRQRVAAQIVTMREVPLRGDGYDGARAAAAIHHHEPLPNVWLGISCEDQATADERIPLLLDTPAAIRFVSCEPLLGPMDVYGGDPDPRLGGVIAGPGLSLVQWWKHDDPPNSPARPGLDWVIVGGESGRNARPMHPDWARSLRDQCQAADVPFFFKQWGEWLPIETWTGHRGGGRFRPEIAIGRDGNEVDHDTNPDDVGGHRFARVGKKKAGRLLDGRAWNEFPAAGEVSP